MGPCAIPPGMRREIPNHHFIKQPSHPPFGWQGQAYGGGPLRLIFSLASSLASKYKPLACMRTTWTVIFGVLVIAIVAPVEASPPPKGALAEAESTAEPSAQGGEEDAAQSQEVDEGQQAAAFVFETRAERPAHSASTQRLEREDLEGAGRHGAEDMLHLVPGLLMTQHGSEGKGQHFFVRGFDAVHGADLAVFVEGIPLNESSNVHAHGYLDLGVIIPEAIEGLEVTKGPFETKHGPFATAGAIDYRLGPNLEHPSLLRYGFGVSDRHRLVALHNLDWAPESVVAIEALHDEGWRSNQGVNRVASNLRVPLWCRGALQQSVLLLAHYSHFGLPGLVRADLRDKGLSQTWGEGESGRALLAFPLSYEPVGLEVRLMPWFELRTLDLDENYTGSLVHPEMGDRHRELEDTAALGLVGEIHWAASAALGLGARVEWQHRALELERQGLTAAGEKWQVERSEAPSLDMTALALHLEYRLWQCLRFFGGLRFDTLVAQESGEDWTGIWNLSPKAGLSWHLSEGWDVFLNYGRGYRPPELRAMLVPEQDHENVNADVYQGGEAEATTSDALELGLSFGAGAWLRGSVALFGTYIERESIYDHISGLNLQLNATQRAGVELAMELQLLEQLRLHGDVSWVDGRFVASGEPVPGAPPWLGNLAIDFRPLDEVELSADLLWVGARPLAYGAQAGAFATVDVAARFQGEGFGVEMRCDNLLDSNWREGEYHFASNWGEGRVSQLPAIHYVPGNPRSYSFAIESYF